MTAAIKTALGEAIELLASAARTTAATAYGSAFALPRGARAVQFVMDLTDAKAASGDKLDVSIQMKLDNTNWVDVAHFTQVLGNGSDTLRFFMKVTAGGAQALFENGTALSADAIRNIIGAEMRVKYVIADGGAHGQSFTFSVAACPV